MYFQYSYNDQGIGVSRAGDPLPDTIEIERPPGLSQDGWHKHATAVCNLLNSLYQRALSGEMR